MERSPSPPRQKFGKYELLERIAVGGMAEVFRACLRGDGGFEKHLVIKRILSHLSSDSDFVVMLIDEAKIAVTLTHPNIVQIYDLGKQDGMYYIAMELIEGADVKAVLGRCASHRMPTAHAVHVVIEVLKGLEYAHQKMGGTPQAPVPLNIIHRDVSPPNVLISYEGEVKLVDFGIAKASVRLMETSAGMLKGKFEYMSPEQARGLALDSRTDLFSVGTVLYELLTGINPFDGPTDLAVLQAVQRARPVPPSRHNPAIPARLEQILLKALSSEREDRYQTAQEMRRDLTAFAYAAGAISNAARLASFMREILGAEIQQGRTVHASAGGPVRVVPAGDPRATAPTPSAPVPFVPPTPASGHRIVAEDESPTTAGISLEQLKQQRTYGTVSGVFGPGDGGLTLGDFASAQDLFKQKSSGNAASGQPVQSMLGPPASDPGDDEFDESPTTVRELSPAELGMVPGAFPPLGGRGSSSTTSLGPTAIPPMRGAIPASPGGMRPTPSPPPVGSLTMHPSGIPILPGMGQGNPASFPPRPDARGPVAQPARVPVPSPGQALALKPLSASEERFRREGLAAEAPTETDAAAPSLPPAMALPSSQGRAGTAAHPSLNSGELKGFQGTVPMTGGAGQIESGRGAGQHSAAGGWGQAGGGSVGEAPPRAGAAHSPSPAPQYWANQAGWASQPIPLPARPDHLPRPEGYSPEPLTRLDAGATSGQRQTAVSPARAEVPIGPPMSSEEVTPRPGEIKPITLGRRGVLERIPPHWRERLVWGLVGLVPGLLIAIVFAAGGSGSRERPLVTPLVVELVGQGESPFVLNDTSVEPGGSRQLSLDAGASYDLRLGGGWGVRLQRIPVEGGEPLFRVTVASPGEASPVEDVRAPSAPSPDAQTPGKVADPEPEAPQGQPAPSLPEAGQTRPD